MPVAIQNYYIITLFIDINIRRKQIIQYTIIIIQLSVFNPFNRISKNHIPG